MACLGITHNKQDTSIVALITYYELFIHSQQQTLDAYYTNITMSSVLISTAKFLTLSRWPQFLIKFRKVVHQLQIKIEALILILVPVH